MISVRLATFQSGAVECWKQELDGRPILPWHRCQDSRFPGTFRLLIAIMKVDVASPRFELNSDGTIDVPAGLGLGVEVDQTALIEFTIKKAQIAV